MALSRSTAIAVSDQISANAPTVPRNPQIRHPRQNTKRDPNHDRMMSNEREKWRNFVYMRIMISKDSASTQEFGLIVLPMNDIEHFITLSGLSANLNVF